MYHLNHIFRLGISYPELTAMQARAIFEAAISMNDQGFEVFPEIMVPLVGTPQVCKFLLELYIMLIVLYVVFDMYREILLNKN